MLDKYVNAYTTHPISKSQGEELEERIPNFKQGNDAFKYRTRLFAEFYETPSGPLRDWAEKRLVRFADAPEDSETIAVAHSHLLRSAETVGPAFDVLPSTVLEYAASVYDDGGPYPYRTTRLAMAFWNAEQAIRD